MDPVPSVFTRQFLCLFDLQNQNFTHVYPCLKVVSLCLYKRPHLTSAQPYFLLSSFLKLCIIIMLQIRCKNKRKMVIVCTVKDWFDLELFIVSLKYKKHTTVRLILGFPSIINHDELHLFVIDKQFLSTSCMSLSTNAVLSFVEILPGKKLNLAEKCRFCKGYFKPRGPVCCAKSLLDH